MVLAFFASIDRFLYDLPVNHLRYPSTNELLIAGPRQRIGRYFDTSIQFIFHLKMDPTASGSSVVDRSTGGLLVAGLAPVGGPARPVAGRRRRGLVVGLHLLPRPAHARLRRAASAVETLGRRRDVRRTGRRLLDGGRALRRRGAGLGAPPAHRPRTGRGSDQLDGAAPLSGPAGRPRTR